MKCFSANIIETSSVHITVLQIRISWCNGLQHRYRLTLYIKRLGNEYIKIKVISDNITQSKITSAYILTGCVTHFCTRHS